jgi:parvulin-like peptidyl-prolyl isomerase
MILKQLEQRLLTILLGAIACAAMIIPGCTTIKPSQTRTAPDGQPLGSATQPESNTPRADNPAPKNAAAFLFGKQLNWSDLMPSLVESAGGQTLVDQVLDMAVDARLARDNIKITDEQLAFEQKAITQALSDNPDVAARLLADLRRQRGLGETRFKALLRRQAGLRIIVQPEILITDAGLQQAYQAIHGPRYEVRLIVVRSLKDASEVRRRLEAGESFIDLAIKLSTDTSRVQGGLLSPITPADPTYPKIIRDRLPTLKVGEASDPLALDNSFAIIRLERKIEGDNVKFDDVKDQMAAAVRRMLETQAIQRTKKNLLQHADIIILDPALKRSWEDQIERLGKEPVN